MAERGQMPRLLRTVFASEDLFRCGLVVEKNSRGDEILSESAGLNPNYIRDLLLPDLWRTEVPEPKTLLHLLLRHAIRLEHATAGLRLLEQRGLVGTLERYERELVKITSDAPTLRELLDRPVVGLTGRRTLAEFLDRPGGTAATPEQHRVDEYRRALGDLEPLPTAELERLFTETLDACAYRLDAWVTSLATQRLTAMRESHPDGVYVGAYGWVEDLRPYPAGERVEVELPAEPGVSAYTFSGGYVQAPSMAHAATAAVLRNAYMSRQGEGQTPYAVDLSSARVRAALDLLDGVREGQPLGAILGYRFERGLHDGGLDQFIDVFRGKYRLGDRGTAPGAEAAEAVAARDVTDGYALAKDYRENRHWTDLSIPDSELMARVDRVIASVDEALDGLADLLMAESVYQLVTGNLDGAGATLNAMAQGAHPPEPAVVQQPRGGIGLTHRVIVSLDSPAGPAVGWPQAESPRSLAEPRLNGWVGRILGDPSRVICAIVAGDDALVPVTLLDLGLQPLDVLALARGEEAGEWWDSELQRRVLASADPQFDAPPSDSGPTAVLYEPPGLAEDQLSFTEVLELARTINTLLGYARPLHPRDLGLPEEAATGRPEASVHLLEESERRVQRVLARLDQALAALDAALAANQEEDLRLALATAAGFGVAGAILAPGSSGVEALAASVRDDLAGRRQRAADTGKDAAARIREILGKDAQFVPAFGPTTAGEWTRALASGPDLGDDPEAAVSAWLAQAARVRPPLDAWRRLSLYAEALGRPAATPRLAQLPHEPDARWVGLPLAAPEFRRPPSGRVSLAFLGEGPGDPEAPEGWAGLLLDEWPEVIPNGAEDVAVAFHYNRPNAEAPQAVLLAVPPTAETTWSLDLLAEIVEATFGLAKTRGFDGEWTRLGGERGHALYDNPWLPMILLADGDPDATVATKFGPCREAQP